MEANTDEEVHAAVEAGNNDSMEAKAQIGAPAKDVLQTRKRKHKKGKHKPFTFVKEEINKTVKQKLQEYKQLSNLYENLSIQSRKRILRHLVEYQQEIAGEKSLRRLLEVICFLVFLFTCLIIVFTYNIYTNLWNEILSYFFIINISHTILEYLRSPDLLLSDSLNFGQDITIVIVGTITIVVLFLIGNFPRYLYNKFNASVPSEIFWGWIIMFTLLCLLIPYISFLPQVGGVLKFILRGASVGILFIIIVASLFSIYYFISRLIIILFNRLNQRKHFKYYPISLIFNYLLSMLLLAKKNQENWMTFEYKREQLKLLEETAYCVENCLPLLFRTGDITTDIWLKDRSKRIAAALRDKKKWILMPTMLTYNDFIDSITKTITHIADGNWDALERKEDLEKLPQSQIWRSIATVSVKVMKVIIAAALPIGGLLLLQSILSQFKAPISGTTLTSVISILVIYEVVVFTSAFDKDFGTNVTHAKDISGLFSGTGGKT